MGMHLLECLGEAYRVGVQRHFEKCCLGECGGTGKVLLEKPVLVWVLWRRLVWCFGGGRCCGGLFDCGGQLRDGLSLEKLPGRQVQPGLARTCDDLNAQDGIASGCEEIIMNTDAR